jgi:hypothetical protein
MSSELGPYIQVPVHFPRQATEIEVWIDLGEGERWLPIAALTDLDYELMQVVQDQERLVGIFKHGAQGGLVFA